jgi:hypothetical protein
VSGLQAAAARDAIQKRSERKPKRPSEGSADIRYGPRGGATRVHHPARKRTREEDYETQRAFIKTLTALAIKGDIRAINALVACARNFAPEDADGKAEELDPADLEILEKFVQRKREAAERASNNDNLGSNKVGRRTRKS